MRILLALALGSLDSMPKIMHLFRQRGTEFRNAFVSTPIPSRSSILTGVRTQPSGGWPTIGIVLAESGGG